MQILRRARKGGRSRALCGRGLKRMERADWLKEREKGIGGSESAAILGMNPYMTNVELWEYKTGRKVRDPKESEYMEYGREAERPLIELFRLDYPKYRIIIPEAYRLQRNEEYPYILGTVDAELSSEQSFPEQSCEERGVGEKMSPLPQATGRKGFLEVKTTNIMASRQKEQWDERVPDNYYIQILHYFLVNKEYEYCYVKAQLKSIWNGGQSFKGTSPKEVRLTTKHYYFERKEIEEDLKYLKEKEIEFWEENVKKDIRPNLALPPI
jgi:putative phage-type endonuclease